MPKNKGEKKDVSYIPRSSYFKLCFIFTQERVVKIDEGERTRTSQRNVNLSLKKMVKVSRLLFSYFLDF